MGQRIPRPITFLVFVLFYLLFSSPLGCRSFSTDLAKIESFFYSTICELIFNVLSDVSYHEPCQVGDEIDDYCNLADADQEQVAGGEPVTFSDAPAVQAQMDGDDEQQHGEAEQEKGIDGDGLADVAMQQGMGCPLTSA